MKIYKTQAEVESDIKDGLLKVNDDVTFDCDINIKAHIICKDLDCRDLNCGNLNCGNLNCGNLNCRNLNCGDLNCGNLNCRNLNCGNLNCMDLNCMDLNCWNLNCGDLNCMDLSYYAIAVAYYKFKCKSVVGRRNNSKHFCLDSKIVITGGGK